MERTSAEANQNRQDPVWQDPEWPPAEFDSDLITDLASAEFRLLSPWLATLEPGELVRLLTLVDPGKLPADCGLDALAAAQRLVNWAEACKVRVINGINKASSDPHDPRYVPDPELGASLLATEVACVLTLPEPTATALVEDSIELETRFPRTLKALECGDLAWAKVQVILEQGAGLPVSVLPEYETRLLEKAPNLTRPQLAAAARRIREKVHPESLATRRRRAVRDRRVYTQPAPDGMAWFSAFIPAEAAVAAFNRITQAAVTLQGPEEDRTLNQLRADVLIDMLLAGGIAAPSTDAGEGRAEGGAEGRPERSTDSLGRSVKDFTTTWRSIRPQVSVTVPVQTCLGADLPGSLDGYGPIPADIARQLAAGAPSFTRLLTHPETGAVLSVGRDSYTVPASLRRYLEIRDKTCRFPGCN